jgi:glycosyltransferase involved in cell wall biosynthesis
VRRIHSDANLVLVGTGEQEKELKKIAGEGIVFSGNIEDVSPYLQCADVFALPSSTEGLSNALLEAMSTGLAVLSTTVGGAPDLIENRKNGWLIAPDRPELLRGALIQLLRDGSIRESYGRNARHVVTERYSLPVVAQKMLELYQRIALRKPVENISLPLLTS